MTRQAKKRGAPAMVAEAKVFMTGTESGCNPPQGVSRVWRQRLREASG
jgi:hypothetical protein